MGGTKKLEAFELPVDAAASRRVSIVTPVAGVAPATLAAARKSIVPDTSRAADREQNVEQLRTRLARKFTTLADEVTECFEDFQIGAGAWGAELTAPEGMSTQGGRHAMQHLHMRPKRRGYPVLLGGQVDLAAKTAELRDHAYMQSAHVTRFGTELEITYDEWEQFLRKCEVVLQLANVACMRVSAPRDMARRARTRSEGVSSRNVALFVLAVVVPFALFVAWRVLAVLIR